MVITSDTAQTGLYSNLISKFAITTKDLHLTKNGSLSTTVGRVMISDEVFLLVDHSRPVLFYIFVFSKVNSKHVHYKISPMMGFEPQTSYIENDRSAN